MKIYNEAWLTIYDSNFSRDKYLYHFTDVEKFVKIIYGKSLKFSKISKTNDTLESKPKIFEWDQNTNDLYEIIKHFRDINQDYLQLLCFTRDIRKINNVPTGKSLYIDYSGRGFALPRMWAQYSKNNTGVCLVFDKSELIRLIEKRLGLSLIHHGIINYISKFQHYKVNFDELNSLIKRINEYQKSRMQQGFADLDFLRSNLDFVKYNYFCKLDDWSGENEYRFLSYGESDYFIKDITDALIGIVVGENIEPANENIIKILCNNVCEVKKITFTYKGCQLTHIN